MIGVVVPANDEAELLPACLASIALAAVAAREPVVIVVVADACSDDTAGIARRAGVEVVTVNARCVGAARRAGADRALARGADWLASTDADTTVDPYWLVAQRRLQRDGAAAVFGTVTVDDWSLHEDRVVRAHAEAYQATDGHRHVHGANLGVSAAAYCAVGGWPALAVHEDVELVGRLVSAGYPVAWSIEPQVRTSARRTGRVSGGFADHLLGLASG